MRFKRKFRQTTATQRLSWATLKRMALTRPTSKTVSFNSQTPTEAAM
jgi:hypothetical protein